MAQNKETERFARIITPMEPDLVQEIDDYFHGKRLGSRSAAVRDLIRLGLDASKKKARG